MPERAGPRPRLGDHLRVAWLLLCTAAGLLPFVLYVPLSPWLTPLLKRRARRRLGGAPAEPEDPPGIPAPRRGGTVFVVAGEASGDALAARVVAALRARDPTLRVRGYGGPACRAAGVDLDEDILERAVIGVLAVAFSVGFWWGLCARTLARLREDPPDLLLTVDFPGLNVRLARWAHDRGVRTVHLVAPQIWAHTPWRILRWRRAVDLLLASFPFEPALFEGAGMRTVFVGHPLFEAPLPAARTPPERPRGRARVELWPGSRRREVGRLAPLLLEAAALLQAEEPGLAFVVRLARPEHEALFGQAGRTARWRPASLSFACREEAGGPPLLGALAASGTASAELAVGLVPLAVIYRIGLFEWCLGRLLVTAPWIALPNLVLGREAVPERLVWAPDAGEALAADFRAVAGDGTRWRATRARLAEVRQRLETPGVAERAARWVEAELNRT